MNQKRIYSSLVTENLERIMGLCDRNPYSPSYGSFDRAYWNYKTTDFSNTRLQETVLTFALLYSKKYPGAEEYYKSEKLLEIIKAALRFWIKIQKRNGSFDEAYTHESSYVATAFSAYAVAETLVILRKELKGKEREELIKSLRKACDFLVSNTDYMVSNHMAGAAAAIIKLWQIKKEEKYLKDYQEIIKWLRENQDQEGWFPEYGGADLGYTTVTVDYLAKCHEVTRDKELLEMAKKAINFVSLFCYPDGSSGGELFSRSTEYIIPSGMEYFADKIEMAKTVSEHLLKGIEKKTCVSLASLDDRYCLCNSYTYLQAYDSFSDKKAKVELPYKRVFREHLENSGLYIDSTRERYLVISTKKGGVLMAMSKDGKKVALDSGIVAKKGDEVLVSQWLDPKTKVEIGKKDVIVAGKLHKMKTERMTSPKLLALRIASKLLGRYLKKILIRYVITGSAKSNYSFKRKITISGKIKVEDQVGDAKGLKLFNAGGFSTVHTASSQYFSKKQLEARASSFRKLRNLGI